MQQYQAHRQSTGFTHKVPVQEEEEDKARWAEEGHQVTHLAEEEGQRVTLTTRRTQDRVGGVAGRDVIITTAL